MDIWEDTDEILQKEDEKRKGDKERYINRKLIFSNLFESSIFALGENKACARSIISSAREALEHHQGDSYEDLYYVNSITGEVLFQTDYKDKEGNHVKQRVEPTKNMMKMVNKNPNIIISLHNHPGNSLPSPKDIQTCWNAKYKYGLVFAHNGNIFKYQTIREPNEIMYEMECDIFNQYEQIIATNLQSGKISQQEFEIEHQKNFIRFSAHALDAGIIIKEVLWDGRPQAQNQNE